MVWVFAAVVLFLAVLVPGFRKVILVGGAILGVVIAIVILANFGGQGKSQTTVSAPSAPVNFPPREPPKLIPADQIQTGELRSNFDGHRISFITVRIHNNSEQDTLDSADFRLTVDDCERAQGDTTKHTSRCATVHDERGSFSLEVPPKQARDVALTLQPAWTDVTILGSPQVKVLVTTARAKAK
jgi:hypothetical protein